MFKNRYSKYSFLFLLLIATSLFSEIINKDVPLNGVWDLKIKKIWEVSRYGSKSMAIPNVAAVLENGIICIFDYKHRKNYIFDNDGRYIASFGRKGEGPGEVKNQSVVFGIDDKFIVVDYSRLHYFTARGVYLNTVLLSADFGLPRLFINDEEYISVVSDTKKSEIKRVNAMKRSVLSVCEIPDYIRGQFPAQDRMIMIVIPPLTPRYEFDFDYRDKMLYYGVNNRYQILVSDLNGTIKNRISLKRIPTILNSQMKRKINREMNLSKRMWNRLPKALTYFNQIHVENGWLLVFKMNFEEYVQEQKIDIFLPDGTYQYRTCFKPDKGEEIYTTYDYNMVMKNGYLYAAIQDRKGDMKVVKYKISLPMFQ
jgi:hypothetical protein